MARDEEIRAHTAELAILCVDDSIAALRAIQGVCGRWFKRVVTARNGREALARVRECAPDMILLDNVMPVMTGLQMLRELRNLGDKTPVILLTACSDKETFTEAIDLGVSKFLAKPLNPDSLGAALGAVALEVVTAQVREQNRRQELELLHLREQYHNQQQEIATRKKRHLLQNDLKCSTIEVGSQDDPVRWFVDIGYRPLQVMSGDGFVVRRLPAGEILIFIVDAMGSGLSASLTATCAVAYLNHLTEAHLRETRHDFRGVVQHFLEFCRTVLLPEEILSCGFLYLDCGSTTAEAALFALPPILVQSEDGEVVKVKGKNPPISRFLSDFHCQTLELGGADALLICSDGLTDAETKDGGNYRRWLPDDFARSFFASDLERLFSHRVADCFDDVTFIRLNRINAATCEPLRLTVSASPEEVSCAIDWVEKELGVLGAMSADCLNEAVVAATEAIMNAFEHGCLGLSEREKARLVAEGGYVEFISGTHEVAGDAIVVEMATRELGGERILFLTVSDSGAGFDLSRIDAMVSCKQFCGRGLRVIKRNSDAMYYNRQGNSLCLMKRIY